MNEDDPDHFVVYGNALPSLDEEEASVKKLKPVPIEEQVVTDENGRRRFHGAFTGGFSAGFFNTAGSRDGWAPKNFKSSREKRAQVSTTQRAEDFMDDEDMGDFGIAPKKFQNAANFRKEQDSERKRKHVPSNLSDKMIPGDPVLDQFLRPSQDTIGIRLLREMGWKPGQGIGAKLTRKRKKLKTKSTKRLFGPSRSDEKSDSEDELDEKYKDFLFAPDDVPNFVSKPKENLFGIGYKGLERSNVLGGGHVNLFGSDVLKFDNADKAKKGRKMKITGQAFGVGAFEEDDDNIYQRDDMSRYDFSLPADHEMSQSPQKSVKKDRKSRWGESSVEASLITCLEGFALSKKSTSILTKRFEPPEIPKGFQPKGVKNKKSRFEPSKDDVLKDTNPTPEERRRVISDEAEKEEFRNEPTESEEQIRQFLAENFSAHQSDINSDNFKPFAKDAAKQKRYEQYLVCVKNGRKNALPILQPKSMADWERDRERVEFERAAILFKPMTFNMASRFVSAGSSETADKEKEVKEKILTESQKAAKMKMYGNLTREVVEWHPAKILCIRFNVKPPYGDSSVTGIAPGTRSKFDIFGRIDELPMTSKTQQSNEEQNSKNEKEAKKEASKGTSSKTVQTENDKDTDEKIEKPPIDLFKSIFLASDSDDSEDEKEDEVQINDIKAPNKLSKKDFFGTELEPKSDTVKPWEQKPENTLRNKNPAKGIFANIDFDALNKPKVSKSISEEPKKYSAEKQDVPKRMSATDFFDIDDDKNDNDETEAFGPSKPAVMLQKSKKETSDDSDDSDEWVEKSDSKKSKRKSSKHKKEKKKHKSKSKKKKKSSSKSKKKHKRRHSSSSDSDSSS